MKTDAQKLLSRKRKKREKEEKKRKEREDEADGAKGDGQDPGQEPTTTANAAGGAGGGGASSSEAEFCPKHGSTPSSRSGNEGGREQVGLRDHDRGPSQVHPTSA